ncbi:hypothetical protein PspLS_11276 [Pyricularia sp. CBS 133598]|nr:hypothetical protein PspLS_11276 [Pyricularia sp. CBS 133598]
MHSPILLASLSVLGGVLGEFINCYNGNVYDSSLHALPQNAYACWLLANGQTVGGYPRRWFNHEGISPPWGHRDLIA